MPRHFELLLGGALVTVATVAAFAVAVQRPADGPAPPPPTTAVTTGAIQVAPVAVAEPAMPAPRPATRPATRAIERSAREAPAAAGAIVGVDPETGELGMPTAEQRAEIEALMGSVSHSGEGLLEVRHPDGSVSIEVGDRFTEYSVARVGPDGRILTSCVNDPRSLIRALRARPAPAQEDR